MAVEVVYRCRVPEVGTRALDTDSYSSQGKTLIALPHTPKSSLVENPYVRLTDRWVRVQYILLRALLSTLEVCHQIFPEKQSTRGCRVGEHHHTTLDIESHLWDVGGISTFREETPAVAATDWYSWQGWLPVMPTFLEEARRCSNWPAEGQGP